MPLVNVENLSVEDMRVKLHNDLAKATTANERMTIYSAYSHSLHEYERINALQNSHYRTMRTEVMNNAFDNHLQNPDLHENILGLIDSTLITYKPGNASQALTLFNEGALDNPYGFWGYNSNLGKHYIKLFCHQADGGMWMSNASRLINMSVIVKDMNETYISNVGEVVIETDNSSDSTITTGSNKYIVLYFTSKAERDTMVRPLFETDELVGEKVYFKAEYKFPQSGIGANWSSTGMEAPNYTPTWLVEEIGREVDP